MARPKVSVIIPVYNTEKYLPPCLDSVLAQSLPDIEIICINDGSQDQSRFILDAYSGKDNRIQAIHQENQGVSAARNRGLDVSTGECIFWMDADDTINPDFLATSYSAAVNQQADIVILSRHITPDELPLLPAVPAWNCLFRREFLDRHPDIRFPVGLQPCEDGLFTHRLFALTDKIALNPDAHYFYRQHPEQNKRAIHRQCERIAREIPQWLAILDDFYGKYGLLPQKAAHLVRFVEHEPFELRYLRMPFSRQQHEELFRFLQGYVNKLTPLLTPADQATLTKKFRCFLTATDAAAYNRKMRVLKLLYFLTKQIPNKRLKRRVKHFLQHDFFPFAR